MFASSQLALQYTQSFLKQCFSNFKSCSKGKGVMVEWCRFLFGLFLKKSERFSKSDFSIGRPAKKYKPHKLVQDTRKEQ